MAQITLTFDLTVESAEALLVLAKMLGGKSTSSTHNLEQLTLDEHKSQPVEKAAPKPTPKPQKTETIKAPETPSESIDAASEISLTDVRAIALKLSKAGGQAALQKIFAKHGAKKLSDVQQTEYPALMADLEEATNG